jgi:DNA replication protein DnaC
MGGEFIDKRENVLLIGNSGMGKTHQACLLSFPACMQGSRVRFHTVTGLVTELLECREDRTLGRLHKHGGRAYEHHSLMAIANLPFESWTEVLCSERLTGALLDHLPHSAHIIEANGQRYRLRQAKKRPKNQSRKRQPMAGKEENLDRCPAGG